jgi:hypothetical protein
MQEAKRVDDFPRKAASGTEGERARERAIYIERVTFFRIASAQ